MMMKNKITLLILSTLISVKAYPDINIIKDSPDLMNTAKKIKKVDREFYVMSPYSINRLEDVLEERDYLLSFVKEDFKDETEFPSEYNKPEIILKSKYQLEIKKAFDKILEGYAIIDEAEAELRYEKMESMMDEIYIQEEIISKIEDKLEFLERETAPYLKLENDAKANIERAKKELNYSQDKVINYIENFKKKNNIEDKELKRITLNRVKKIESRCPKIGFLPKGENSRTSFYFFQINNRLCLSTTLSDLSYDTVVKLMKDEGFIKLYNEHLVIHTESNLKLGRWRLKYSYGGIDNYKEDLRNIQKISRPAIMKIENKLGIPKSKLLVNKQRALDKIDREQDKIDIEMELFDKGYFKRKKEASEMINFDAYKNAVLKMFYNKSISIYKEEIKRENNTDYEIIEVEDTEAPIIIIVDYLKRDAEIRILDQRLANKYKFEISYGWNKSSSVKMKQRGVLITDVVEYEKLFEKVIVDETIKYITTKKIKK